MKKHCLVSTLIILSLVAGTAQAQVLIGLLLGDKVSSETFHLGAEIGVNLANLSELEGSTLIMR